MEFRSLKTCTSKPVESHQLLLSALHRAFKDDKVLSISKSIPEFDTAMEINLTLAKKLTEVSQIKQLMKKEHLAQLKLLTEDRSPKVDVYALLYEVLQNKEIVQEISESPENVTAAAANHSLITALVNVTAGVKDKIDKDLWALLDDCSQLPVPQVAESPLKSNDCHLEEDELGNEKNQCSEISAEKSDGGENGADEVLDIKALQLTLKESVQYMQGINDQVASLRVLVQRLVDFMNLPKETKDDATIAGPTKTNTQEEVSAKVEIVQQAKKPWYNTFLKYMSMLQNIIIIAIVTAIILDLLKYFRGSQIEKNSFLFMFLTIVILNIFFFLQKLCMI